MKKVFQFFKRIFGKESRNKLAIAAIDIVNAIKKVADNPALDLITALTKTKVDDVILAKIRKVLPIISEQLLRQHGKVSNSSKNITADEIMHLLIRLINDYKDSKDNRTNLLSALAAKILQELTDGSIDYFEAKAQTQKLYRELKAVEGYD